MNHDKTDGGITRHELARQVVLDAAGGFCAAFSHTSALGFAILDDQLRYQYINSALAAINGIPADAHLGNSIREIFGSDIAGQIEPRVQRLMMTGARQSFEIHAVLPTRSEPGSFIENYFGIRGTAGRLNRIGLIVVEVTQQRKLDALMKQLTSDLLRSETWEECSLARELHDSISEYHFALEMTIDHLTRTADKSADLLALAVESLDDRVLGMRKLVAAATRQFPLAGGRAVR